LVYPLIGQSEYGWEFTGTDIDPVAITSAKQICDRNTLNIPLRLQTNREDTLKGAIQTGDRFHVILCNPPFHSSMEEANRGTQRKWRNLGKGKSLTLNFGGQNTELWCPGGEVWFISNMIEQSKAFAKQCLWFTSLVSKKDNLPMLLNNLERAQIADFKVVEMAQGQKVSRFIAWTYIQKHKRPAFMNGSMK
jgi:23S rRNA (adenine1618-N6)-methyltransferase